MSFTSPLPIWNNPGQKPPASTIERGWGAGEYPPADWFNWQWYTAYKALEEIQKLAATTTDLDAHTKDTTLHVSITEKTAWNDKETKSGAQTKANTAEENAKTYVNQQVGDKTTLLTANKTNLTAAVNELFTSANNGKEGIANVIGAPLTKDQTFAQMKTSIQTLKNQLATNLVAQEQPAQGSESLQALINKVPNIYTGKKWARGTGEGIQDGTIFKRLGGNDNAYPYLDIAGLDFIPGVVVAVQSGSPYHYVTVYTQYPLVDGLQACTAYMRGDATANTNVYATSFDTLNIGMKNGHFLLPLGAAGAFKWIAYEW
ncbi:hypothetical protein [Priestia endophytica]|uniref:Tail fiber protein n=1 Tax=Priestia endophytica TaxID=135735 RepID=A0AAX1Q7H3_9BACI|nr:hypothetical protein [Priestia endophytica]RAS75258.1 hypothetical protein A3864_16465 [Priestia endophytica]